jgi:rubredoxin
MKKLRCKACGYIIDENHLKDKCPACGVLKAAFEPYESRVSEQREKLMGFHIHPIIIHLPQALGVVYLASLCTFLFSPFIKNDLASFLKILVFILPVSIIIGFLSGLFDGKIRFKKLKTPHLQRKIILGSIFILSGTMPLIFMLAGIPEIFSLIPALVAFVSSVALGLIGDKLIECKMPG